MCEEKEIISKEKWRVHRTNCCIIHGCEYGEDNNCPVCQGLIKQDYLCEYCEPIDDLWGTQVDKDTQKKSWDTINKTFQKIQRKNKLEKILTDEI